MSSELPTELAVADEEIEDCLDQLSEHAEYVKTFKQISLVYDSGHHGEQLVEGRPVAIAEPFEHVQTNVDYLLLVDDPDKDRYVFIDDDHEADTEAEYVARALKLKRVGEYTSYLGPLLSIEVIDA